MKRITYILSGLLLISAFACEDTIQLDTDQIKPQVTIEGVVTDQERNHFVRITRSLEFYNYGTVPGVTNATVTVRDNEGNTYNYIHNPENTSTEEGYYFSETSFAGEVGRTYTLEVNIGNEQYTATDVMHPVTAIDSLAVRIDEDEFADPEKPGYYHEILFYTKEPRDRVDYYLFKFYRNDSIILDEQNDIYFADDELLGEKIDGIPIAGRYKKGDVVRVEMYSISRQGFIFYNDLFNILNSDGGMMFSPPPANPRTNLTNDALGYFQTSAFVSESIIVE